MCVGADAAFYLLLFTHDLSRPETVEEADVDHNDGGATARGPFIVGDTLGSFVWLVLMWSAWGVAQHR